MTLWLRSLLIVALAIFAAPRVMAADGVTAVICAADGSRQVVLFDFESGTPVEQSITFETCDNCLTPPIGLASPSLAVPLRSDARSRETPPAPGAASARLIRAPSARGPPRV